MRDSMNTVQALVHRAILRTPKANDFNDVPRLRLLT